MMHHRMCHTTFYCKGIGMASYSIITELWWCVFVLKPYCVRVCVWLFWCGDIPSSHLRFGWEERHSRFATHMAPFLFLMLLCVLPILLYAHTYLDLYHDTWWYDNRPKSRPLLRINSLEEVKHGMEKAFRMARTNYKDGVGIDFEPPGAAAIQYLGRRRTTTSAFLPLVSNRIMILNLIIATPIALMLPSCHHRSIQLNNRPWHSGTRTINHHGRCGGPWQMNFVWFPFHYYPPKKKKGLFHKAKAAAAVLLAIIRMAW